MPCEPIGGSNRVIVNKGDDLLGRRVKGQIFGWDNSRFRQVE
jgi:hypothetical protein